MTASKIRFKVSKKFTSSVHMYSTVFCPGLKKGTVLLEGKGHFRARNYILRTLLRAELHYEGTFLRGIVIRRKKNYNFIGAI